MTTPPGFEPVGMSNVDESADPTAMVSYLDQMAAAVGDRRRASYRLLDLREGQRFLDVGCGAGEVLIDVAGLVGPSGLVSGVDLAETMVEATRARLRDAGVEGEVKRADAHRLPFGDGSFDRVRIERVLQHVDDPVTVLAEIRRVLVPGGMVLAVDPNHEQADVATADVETWRVLRRHAVERVRHPHAGLHLREWLVAAGLVDVRLEPSAFAAPWPLFRTMILLDRGAENAIAAGELRRERFEKWLEEQDARHAPRPCLRLVHRRLRHARPAGREGAAGGAAIEQGRSGVPWRDHAAFAFVLVDLALLLDAVQEAGACLDERQEVGAVEHDPVSRPRAAALKASPQTSGRAAYGQANFWT